MVVPNQTQEVTNIETRVGWSFRALREKRGVSQETLANAIETGQPNISRFERGQANPTLGFMKRIANALGGRLEITIKPREE